MGKKDKNKKKGKGAEKTALKTDKKLIAKQKKLLEKLGETDIVEVVVKLEAEEARRKTVTETICQPPTPRSNYSICTHPDKEEIILFGGEFFNGQKLTLYNELYFYNIPKNEWKLIQSPAGPAPRSAHQMVSVANDGGQLWIFGGEHPSPSQMQFYHFKDLWVYRLSEKKWEKISPATATASSKSSSSSSTSNIGPSARSGHRMVAVKKKLFVFGGFYDSGVSYKYFNDLWQFSLETYQWQEIQTTGSIKPSPRSAACMVASSNPDGKIIVWGGYSRTSVKKEIDRGVTHQDMFALVPDKNDSNKFKWEAVKAGGARPIPRSGVSATIAPNGLCYIFGGVLDTDEDEENLQGNFTNEVHMLDLSTNAWRQIQLKLPKAKKGKAVKSKNESGGIDDDEMVEENQPNKAVTTNDGIFTMTVGSGSSGNGTTNSQTTLADGKSVTDQKNTPSARMKSGLVVCKGQLYLYGGIYEDGDRQITLADFYSLDLHKLDAWKTIIKNDLNPHEWLDSDNSDSSDDDDSDDDDDDDDDDDSDDDSDEMDTD